MSKGKVRKQVKVDFNNLGAQWDAIKDVVQPKLDAFFQKGYYIGGGEVEAFEEAFAEYTSTNYAIGCSNGTDGLKLALQALELKGRTQVIMPANGYIADIYSVKYQHGDFDIELIDHDDYFQIDTKLLETHLENRRKDFDNIVLLPVHLYGHVSDMKEVSRIASKFKCYVIEDASQAHGARTSEGKMVGQYGDLCVYSCYPGKNLGAIGDAGVITTNIEEYRTRLLALRNLGSIKKYEHIVDGWNNRMDSIQAIFLKEKLTHLDQWNSQRRSIAALYSEKLKDVKQIKLPIEAEYSEEQVFHIYCLRVENREELQKHLIENGVHTVIHYPISIQSSVCNKGLVFGYENNNTEKNSKSILSLPMHPFMNEEQVEFVVNIIKDFYADNG